MPNIGQQHSIEKSRQLQRNLYLAAKKDKQRRFHALYDRIFRLDILWRAWKEVRENKGSAGIDGITFEMIEEYGVEEYLLDIQEDLKNKKYRPKPVKRVYIPKPDGKQRPLGIPTIRDRIVQQSCKIVIEPVFEANFLDSSYGFRPKRDAELAFEHLKRIMTKLKLTLNPQKTKIVDMNKESFDFLGFRYQKFGKTKSGRKLPYMMPSKKAMKKVKDAIRVITCRKSTYEGLEQKVEKLNPLIRGWRNYFQHLHLADTYVDNGWTGVNTDRPEFQRLLNDIRDGKIKALVLKDFSRFSRNYIEAGNLLENIFPALGVRFISVVDRYDSLETDGSASSLMIPLKNLINSFYSKDQSKKVSLAIHAKQLAGEHLPSKIPYGYRKSETEAYRLEPDLEAAPIVKRVYAAFLAGESIRSIYHALNEEGIPCPGKLKYLRGEMKRKCYADSQWSQQTVKWLLINPINMGDLVFGRTCKALYLGQAESRRVREEEQWRILPDMHEALVSREDFYRVQALLTESRKAYDEKSASTADYRSKHPQIFKNGMVRCGVCGGNMGFTRKAKVPNGMYICRKKEYGRCTEWVDITEDNLAPVVWNAIQDHLALYADFDAVTKRLKDTGIQVQRQSDIQSEMQRIADKLGDFQRKREQLYVDYSDGILTAGDYMELKSRFDTKYQEQSAKLNQLSVELAHLNRALSSENKWLQNAKNIRKARKLTPQVAEAMIDHVNIFKTGRGKRRVEIFFRYQEDKDALEAAIKELEGGE